MICLIAYHQLYPLFMLMIYTKCIKAISTIDDSRLMQSDLDSISQWSSDTELFFNESKFAHICFGLNPLLLICQNIISTVRLHLKLSKSRTRLVLSYPRIRTGIITIKNHQLAGHINFLVSFAGLFHIS